MSWSSALSAEAFFAADCGLLRGLAAVRKAAVMAPSCSSSASSRRLGSPILSTNCGSANTT
jgi:hypothetical protein